MLYSIELGDLVFLFSGLGFLASELALFDPGLLTRELTQVEYSGPADLTDLVQLDVLDERGLEGEILSTPIPPEILRTVKVLVVGVAPLSWMTTPLKF